MSSIQERLSAEQAAELAARAQERPVPPELDFGQLAKPEDTQTTDPGAAHEAADTQASTEAPAASIETQAATISTEPRKLPWQTRERRVATSTQGAPKPPSETTKAAAATTSTEASKPHTAPRRRKAAQTSPKASTRATSRSSSTAAKKTTSRTPGSTKIAAGAGKEYLGWEDALDKAKKRWGGARIITPGTPPETTRPETARKPRRTKAEMSQEKAIRLSKKLKLGKYVELDQNIYSNGAKHVYGVDKKGKQVHLSHDAVLESYGYKPQSKEYKADLAANQALGEAERLSRPHIDSRTGVVVDPERIANAHQFWADKPLNWRGAQAPAPSTSEGPQPVVLRPLQPLVRLRIRGRMGMAWEGLKHAAGVYYDIGPDGRVVQRPDTAIARLMLSAENYAFAKYDKWKALPESTRRRRLMIATVAGAVAVGAAAAIFMESRGYGISGNGATVPHDPDIHPHGHGGNAGIINALDGHGHRGGNNSDKSGIVNALGGGHAGHGQEALNLRVHRGDMPWNVLHNAGIPDHEIMARLDGAAKESGLPYQWHGQGTHRWLEVSGKSGTKAVLKLIGPYIKK